MGDEGWTLDVRVGQTSREIRDLAREIDATAIVLAAQPHGLFGQAITGVRATQVLRGAPCPVLTVETTFAELPRKIIAAVDFSPASVRAAQAALMLAADNSIVTLVYVAEPFVHPRESARATLRKDIAVLFGRLRDELAPYTPAGSILQTRELEGEVVQQLLQCANSLGAELIATGTAGPGLIERMFLGSTATSLIHLARCSVIASPSPRATEAVDIALHVRGTATISAPNDWPSALDAISRRDMGRRVTMEVDDRDIGAQIEASGYFLRGITFDPHDRRVAIMLESPQGKGAHLTRSIAHVDEIGISAAADGSDGALIIKHGRGQTLLLLSS
jgi:nucleotide-binding universal stress UspA family protein